MKKILLAILFISLTFAQNSIFDKHLKEQNFMNYSKRNSKKYSNLEEALYRFSIYKDNIKVIEQLNQENPNATFAENKFTDLTQEEFLAKYAGAKPPGDLLDSDRKLDSESHARNLGSYPASVDLRNKSTQPIRNQGECGSCWAFSAVATMEYAYWKKTTYSGNMSEQQLVDCTYDYDGCLGGWPTSAFDHILKVGGLAWESDYKYTGKYGTCKAKTTFKQVRLDPMKPYVTVASDDDSIKSAIANIGVLAVCIDASGWGSYQSGIYMDTRLKDQKVNPTCTHGVGIVGYGTENGIPYYIIRNSWDAQWGEKGYMKMDARRYPNNNSYSGMFFNTIYYPKLWL